MNNLIKYKLMFSYFAIRVCWLILGGYKLFSCLNSQFFCKISVIFFVSNLKLVVSFFCIKLEVSFIFLYPSGSWFLFFWYPISSWFHLFFCIQLEFDFIFQPVWKLEVGFIFQPRKLKLVSDVLIIKLIGHEQWQQSDCLYILSSYSNVSPMIYVIANFIWTDHTIFPA